MVGVEGISFFIFMAYWASGQDVALSRRKQGFDSPTSCFDLVIFFILTIGKEWTYKSTPYYVIKRKEVLNG